MSYVRVWIHAVWGTKDREPILTSSVRTQIIRHICESARQRGFYVDRIGGYTGHLHCLAGLNADISIANTLQLMKGESAHWVNKVGSLPVKFERANEYYAVSVSESHLSVVRAYIEGQVEHHRKKTYLEDVNELLKDHHLLCRG